jgi:hypothetical protein
MATTEEKQDLVDTIKRPVRHYRIKLWGYGGEILYGKSNNEEYDFWETNINERRKEFNIPEDDAPFYRYIMDKDDIGGYEAIPENLQRIGEWYEQDDIDHGNGVTYESAIIEIIEVENDECSANEIEEILQKNLDELVDENGNELIIGDSEATEQPYVLYAMSVEKGTFFDGCLTINGKIDLLKLRFACTEYPNGDVLVDHIFYDDEEIYNTGGDTISKALYIELINH